MTVKVWDGSKWAISSQIKVWDGSVWKDSTNANVHIWTGTAWQKVHPPVYLDQGTGYAVFGNDPNPAGPPYFGNAGATLTLFANGKIQTFTSDSTSGTVRTSSDDWLLTGANSEYDVFVNGFTGDTLDGGSAPTDGTRSILSTDRTFQLTRSANGSSGCSFNLILCANNSSGTSSNVEIQNTFVQLTADVGFI